MTLLLEPRATGRIFSFGGGVQSVATLVLQAQGRPNPYDAFVFANVGEDSENPATLAYLRQVVLPFAQEHSIRVVEVQKKRRNGELDTLWKMCFRAERKPPRWGLFCARHRAVGAHVTHFCAWQMHLSCQRVAFLLPALPHRLCIPARSRDRPLATTLWQIPRALASGNFTAGRAGFEPASRCLADYSLSRRAP